MTAAAFPPFREVSQRGDALCVGTIADGPAAISCASLCWIFMEATVPVSQFCTDVELTPRASASRALEILFSLR